MKEMEQKNSSIRTFTTLFVLPLLGIKREEIINDNFINVYLYLDTSPEEEEYVYIIHKNVIPKLAILASSTQVEKGKYTIYAIPIPDDLKHFIRLFLEGKYSKFLPNHKQKILSFWGLSKHSRLSNILYPEDYLFELSGFNTMLYKKGEIWPKPNTTKETFISNNNN